MGSSTNRRENAADATAYREWVEKISLESGTAALSTYYLPPPRPHRSMQFFSFRSASHKKLATTPEIGFRWHTNHAHMDSWRSSESRRGTLIQERSLTTTRRHTTCRRPTRSRKRRHLRYNLPAPPWSPSGAVIAAATVGTCARLPAMTSVDTATVGVPTVCEFRPRKQVSSTGDRGTTARATAVSGLLYM